MQELSSTQLVRAGFNLQSWRIKEIPCTITSTLSKGEAKSEGKTEAGARALSWVDAEVAVGPSEQGKLVPDQELTSVAA